MKTGPGIYVYDPEKDDMGKGDALGSAPSNGRTYLRRFQELVIELEDGSHMQIKMRRDKKGIEIRNKGHRMTTGLAVIPRSTNVIEVLPSDA